MYENSILDGETGGYQPVPMQWISSGKLTKLNETKLGFYFYKESKIKNILLDTRKKDLIPSYLSKNQVNS